MAQIHLNGAVGDTYVGQSDACPTRVGRGRTAVAGEQA